MSNTLHCSLHSTETSTQVKKTAREGELREYFICYKYDRPHWFQFTENYLMDIIFTWFINIVNTDRKRTPIDRTIVRIFTLQWSPHFLEETLQLFILSQFLSMLITWNLKASYQLRMWGPAHAFSKTEEVFRTVAHATSQGSWTQSISSLLTHTPADRRP